MPNFGEEIKKFFRGDVKSDNETLERLSHDASLFKIQPTLSLSPKDSDDVSKVVAYISEKKKSGINISITGRSAGTDMSGGPLTESIVMEFTPYMNALKEIGKDYAVVEPGMYYRDFEKTTLEKGLIMPSYPASRDLCAIGGMVSNDAGGEKTLTYGKVKNYVNSLKVVLADGSKVEFKKLNKEELEEKKKLNNFEGEIYRKMYDLCEKNYDLLSKAKPNVTKNSAGYYLWDIFDKEKQTFDLSKLIVGSQGTLSLVTETNFKLVKPEPYSRLVVVFLNETKNLASVISDVLKFKPESLESYDDHTFRFAIKLFPMVLKRMGGSAISLALRFWPEFKALITGGIPKIILLAEFTGGTDDEAKEKATKALFGLLEKGYKAQLTKSREEAEKYWVIRRESFNLLRQKMKGMRTAPFIDDFAVHPDDLPKFLPELYKILDKYNLTYTTAGHMGDANFHIIPLMDLTKINSKKIISELMDQVYKLVLDYHGTITAEHNDGLIRSSYLEMMFGKEVYKLFEETKKIFDPLNIFNPGKKVNSSLSYAMDHLVNKNS
jgi:FAD/FMN-containing dehydrogenase